MTYQSTQLLYACALTTLSTISIAAEAERPTLCTASEKIHFNCETSSGKIISLCGTSDRAHPSALQYRFGRQKKTEFSYPEPAAEAKTVFSYVHYSRYQVDRTLINFRNGDFKYSIFDIYEGDQTPATVSQGVEVIKNGKVMATKRCVSAAESHLAELEDALPCDADDPLQLGGCSNR